MNYTEYRITLDIHDTVSPVVLNVKKGDTKRRLLIHLVERGYPYHIEDDCYAAFTAKKPDGNKVYNDCDIEDCVIAYNLTDQVTAVSGLVNCEVRIYGADGGLLTSASFTIIVEDTIYEDGEVVETPSVPTRVLLSPIDAKVGQYLQIVAVSDDGTVIQLAAVDTPESGSSVRVAEISLISANWVGDASPYSQVVEIEGITEYSQVDLKPSVEQLAIFHDKDLAFVTENDDGVVTVYAIGDKPANDYTIQVSITEVNV